MLQLSQQNVSRCNTESLLLPLLGEVLSALIRPLIHINICIRPNTFTLTSASIHTSMLNGDLSPSTNNDSSTPNLSQKSSIYKTSSCREAALPNPSGHQTPISGSLSCKYLHLLSIYIC